jgi:NAD(P)-dependent dehydrogenase (short-subunit alcohol dehydrogenase family)
MTKRNGILLGAAAAGAAFAARQFLQTSREDVLAGEIVLITGGSRGLGLALAREFAREKCSVAICARDKKELSQAADDLRSRGAKVFTYPCDVGKQKDVNEMIDAVMRHYGRIDTLVNNAGVIQVGPAESFGASNFEDAGNGRIVNISSIGGKVGVPHLLPYSSAKFAVAGFTQTLAAEMRPKGIHVTGIYPGTMRTGSFVQALFKGDQKKESEWFTLGASLPGISLDTKRAARQIVTAVKRGETERVLSIPAKALSTFNKLFPGGTSQILSMVAAALLPKAHAGSTKKGSELLNKMNPIIRGLSELGLRVMRTYNQKA